jgi:MFS family permease
VRPRASTAPLREREFRLLFLGRTVSVAGSAIAPIALAFAVLELTDSLAALGIVLAARIVPQIVFLLLGGVWADRLPRHLVMVGSNVLSALAQGTVALLLLTDVAELWHLVLLQLVAGASSAFFFPASAGVVPQTVPRTLLQPANALLRLSLNSMQIAGAAAGGVLVATAGSGWALAFDAVTYLAAGAVLALMRLPPSARAETTNVLADLQAGWREFSTRTWLWGIVIGFGFLNATHEGATNVIGPAVARDDLGGADSWGLILSAKAAGLVVGGLLLLRFRVRRPLLVGCSAAALTAPGMLLLALDAPVALIALAYLLTGIGIELMAVLWDVALQENVPQETLSRVYSYDMLGSFVLIPVGLLLAGPIADAIGRDATLLLAVALLLVVVAAMLSIREVRTLERHEAEPEPEVVAVSN